MQTPTIAISLQVKMLVFNRSAPADRPKPLNENIVQGTTLGVHANPYFFANQRFKKIMAGKLAALVSIENLRLSPLG